MSKFFDPFVVYPIRVSFDLVLYNINVKLFISFFKNFCCSLPIVEWIAPFLTYHHIESSFWSPVYFTVL